ncbi:MAG: iron/ascorbate oxidoreductase [Chitinophagales bacterium]|nr:MAG: iron/ascorbate oxidoreductase [Chitinophagales bacterium]
MQKVLPVIDIAPLMFVDNKVSDAAIAVSKQIREACMEHGFFYIRGHQVSATLQDALEHFSQTFFALDEKEKMQIAMHKGGRAWRGYFPIGGELTSGKPDWKEGLYFGTELPPQDERVQRNLPLHGQNLFPERPAELKSVVLEYMHAVTQVGHAVMRGIALSLDLAHDYFYRKYTSDPLILFRIFHYPPQQHADALWGVGEHTDYGLLTILKQDMVGGLQVKSRKQWIDAPPLPGTFVCNIGDMLERITNGLYRSTPHRVINQSGKSRFSYPLFFDPNFEAVIEPIKGLPPAKPADETRWDKEDIHLFHGTYGSYLLRKVSRVFPELQKQVL